MQFDQMRKQGASIFVYLIFCLLIAIFVINFRPGQSRNDDNGCRGTSNVVMSVDGTETTQTAFKIAYSTPYNRGTGKQKIYVALETLIRRELLADAAEARGLMVDEGLIQDEIKKGHYYIGGQRTGIPGILDEDGIWNGKVYKNWIGQLNVSPNAYLEEQKRSMLAAMMAQVLQESVQVSREEALQKFLGEGNTATYDVVAFRPEAYRSAMKITDADVDRYLASHGDDVQARYKTDERTYKGLKPELKLRQIFIAKLEPPKPAEPPPAAGSGAGSAAGSAAGSGAGSAAAVTPPKQDDKKDAKKDAKKDDKKADVKPVGMPIEDAKKKLEAVRAAGGKEKFIAAAKELSTDEALKATAGDIGWHKVENPALGDKAVNDAVKTLKPGEMTPVIATDNGVWLVLAEDKREGDLSFDQVKREIALSLAKDMWGKEAAKRAAIAALDQARNGVGMNLDQLYEKDAAPSSPGMDLEQMLNDPNVPEETKQKLRELIEKSGGGKHGALEVQEKDHPAGWFEDDSGAAPSGAPATPAPAKSGSAATPAPATPAPAKSGSAATPAPATPAKSGSAAPTPSGSSAPSAAPSGAGAGAGAPAPSGSGAAAGSGAGSGAAGSGAGAPPAPAVDPLAPTKDQLPAMGTVAKAHVNRYGPSTRSKQMPGLGSSKDAITAVFDELQPGNLAKHIYEADGAYIVVQLIAKSQANVADFDKDADRRVAEMRRERGFAFLEEWMKSKCETLAKDNKIHPNPELLTERDDQGKILPIGYKPCMSFR